MEKFGNNFTRYRKGLFLRVTSTSQTDLRSQQQLEFKLADDSIGVWGKIQT